MAASVVKSPFVSKFAVAKLPVFTYGLYPKYSNFDIFASRLVRSAFVYSCVSPQNFTVLTNEVFGL